MRPERASVLVRQVVAVLLAAGVALHAAAETKVRTSSFAYGATGLLTQEVVEPSRPDDCLETTYTHDAWGNKETATSKPCTGATGYTIASGEARTTRTSHAPDGRFPRTTTNALGQSETRDYDARFGTVSRLTGPNGLTTTWEYDGFGRKTRETRADGTFTTWSYLPCTATGASCPSTVGGAVVVWVLVEDSLANNAAPMAPSRRQYHDMLDRVVRVQTTGFDLGGAGAVLVQDTEYDRLGRVARKSQVYALSGGNPNWATFSYDVLGRVKQESVPDPDAAGGVATTTVAYDGLTTTVTNSKQQRKTTLKNAQGQVARVIDHDGNAVVFSYDALGQLKQTNAAGSITTLDYNQHGQKVAMADPAMGAWQYRYNAFGELVWQRDSLGRVATLEYDRLGRMKRRSEPDLVSTWTYDSCSKGIGKLCEATADNGYRRTHAYDALGRPSTTTTALDNPAQPATETLTYDPATGRLATKTWPTGYQVRYQYTARGFLRQVMGGGTAAFPQVTSYDVLEVDAKGRITRYRQGTQVTTVRTFDDAAGRLRTINANREGASGGIVVAHSYGYDSLGNLTRRNDSAPGVLTAENFTYDNLNRLSTAAIVGGAVTSTRTTQVIYDPRGNILYKSDVGRYWYDADRPSRLTNITLETAPGATVMNTGTRALSFGFDDGESGAQVVGGVALGNGNLVYTVGYDAVNNRHTQRRETYTSFNMPLQFTLTNGVAGPPDRTLNFVYGPEHQRVKQQVQLADSTPGSYNAGSTWYLHEGNGQSLSYEKEVRDRGLVEHKHYLSAGGAVFALFVTRTGLLGGQPPTATRYFHHDHLGSVVAITDDTGAVIERLAYDPWGKRRNVNGLPDTLDAIVGWNTDRGFTMHEHLDEMGVVHMNGRVYDPLVGRFMSADPLVADSRDLQEYNRYTYVGNSPVTLIDPSGHFKIGSIFKAAAAMVVGYMTGGLIATFLLESAGMAGSAFVSMSGGTIFSNAASLNTLGFAVSGAGGGFAAGVVGSGSLEGGLRGAFAGAAFGVIGGIGTASSFSTGQYMAAHAVGGCMVEAASGGKCGQGALSSALAKWSTQEGFDLQDDLLNGVKAAVVGGATSTLIGGEFANGAASAAFAYLFNAKGGAAMSLKGIRGFASLVKDMATMDFDLAEPEVWGRTGAGERFRADGVFVQAKGGAVVLGGAVAICEAKCGETTEVRTRQGRVYEAVSRNDFYLEGPKAASVAARAGLTVDSAGRVYIPTNRFMPPVLGVYEGSTAHLKPGATRAGFGTIIVGPMPKAGQ